MCMPVYNCIQEFFFFFFCWRDRLSWRPGKWVLISDYSHSAQLDKVPTDVGGRIKGSGSAAFSSTVLYVIAFDAVSILLGALVWVFSEDSKHQDIFMPILFLLSNHTLKPVHRVATITTAYTWKYEQTYNINILVAKTYQKLQVNNILELSSARTTLLEDKRALFCKRSK